MNMIYTYEILNKKTHEHSVQFGANFVEACKKVGWKAYNCRCIYKTMQYEINGAG